MKKFKKFAPTSRRQAPPRPPGRSPSGRSSVGHGMPQGRCVVGIHAVNELLKVRPGSVTQIFLREKFQDHVALSEIHNFAKSRSIKLQIQSVNFLDKLISSNQGVVAFSDSDPELDWKSLEDATTACVVALDEVEDPHNLGAILRTGWLLGVKAIFTPERRSAKVSPAVSKVAQGAVEHVPLLSGNALPEQIQDLKKAGFWVLGLSHEAKQNLFDLKIPEKVVWVMGSESSGIRKSVVGVCDELISIPQMQPDASYNVSVAAAIALAETHRQFRQHIKGN